MKVEEKLALNVFKNDKESHIKIHQDICRKKCLTRFCISVCPAHLYSFNEETKEIVVEFAGCLECGTCKVVCKEGAIEWIYPKGEYGVQYRFG
ncbi:MAG TPA: hypothetical protein DDW17_09270 [Deltaproteobacteria bacterium]|nr:hypothetical protein [Deltaproteobacteria bacterium]